jgi:hypothetical protein
VEHQNSNGASKRNTKNQQKQIDDTVTPKGSESTQKPDPKLSQLKRTGSKKYFVKTKKVCSMFISVAIFVSLGLVLFFWTINEKNLNMNDFFSFLNKITH